MLDPMDQADTESNIVTSWNIGVAEHYGTQYSMPDPNGQADI